jgi:4-carboxymuconolactone decarboxylase
MTTEDERLAKGREVMDRVYGPGFSDRMPPAEHPLVVDTVTHLFGEIWSRPGLSIRDRRLLVMGATASMGRADLLEVQIRGALANGELTEEQLHEAALHMQYYVGAGNAVAMHRAILASLAEAKTEER